MKTASTFKVWPNPAGVTLNREAPATVHMKYLMNVLLVMCSYSSTCQEYFSKRFDAGGTNFYNRLRVVIMDNDTLYYSAFNVCDYTDTSATDCATIGMMDKYGNVMVERSFDWLNPIGDTKPMCISEDKLLITATNGWYDESVINLLILNKNNLDSIGRFQYVIGQNVQFYAASGVIEYGDHYIVTGWCRLADEDIWPDWMLWINKSTMELDTILEYPFVKRAAKYEYLYVDSNNLLTAYFAGHDLIGVDNSRGFIKYDTAMNIVFAYFDTIDNTTGLSYEHAGLLQANGNMVYKQEFRRPSWYPLTNVAEYEVLCIDSDGEILWQFYNPGWSSYSRRWVYSLSETRDGDILGCGEIWGHFNPPYRYEFDPFDTIPDPPFHDPPAESDKYFAPYIFKLDGVTGDLIWQYALVEMDEYWHSGPLYLSELYELSDGSLMGGGGYAIRDAEGDLQSYDSWVVRLPPDGCLFTGSSDIECGFESWLTGTEDIILIDVSEEKLFMLFPNPATEKIQIKVLSRQHDLFQVHIRSLDGKLLSVQTPDANDIDLNGMPDGVLLVELLDKTGSILQVERMIKL